MATRSSDVVGRLAVERARARNPTFAPDSVEVVELTRGSSFVLVRTAPTGLVCLDERGRLVRGRERLVRIARHLRAVRMLEEAQDAAQLERRAEMTGRSIELLAAADRDDAARVLDALRELEVRLEAVVSDRGRGVLTTERTIRTRIDLHNEAARADRDVVRATRQLAGALAASEESSSASRSALERWVKARLDSADLPFFHPELDARESAAFVEEIVVSARSS